MNGLYVKLHHECVILPGRTNPFSHFHPHPGATPPPPCHMGSLFVYPKPTPSLHPLSQPVPTPYSSINISALPPILPFYVPFPRYADPTLVPIFRVNPHPSPTHPFTLLPHCYDLMLILFHMTTCGNTIPTISSTSTPVFPAPSLKLL